MRGFIATLLPILYFVAAIPRPAQAGFDCIRSPAACSALEKKKQEAAKRERQKREYLKTNYSGEFAQSQDFKKTLYAGLTMVREAAEKSGHEGEWGVLIYKDKYGYYYAHGFDPGRTDGQWVDRELQRYSNPTPRCMACCNYPLTSTRRE